MNKMETPLVSVVMPVYNAARYLEASVRSILGQSVKELELIVVDDCSTDGTWELLLALAGEDARIRTVRTEKNSGSAKYPREKAVQMAQAPLICWIDSDDLVDEGYLEALLNRRRETEADIVCSRMAAFNEESACVYSLPPQGFDYSSILSGKDALMLTIGEFWGINVNGCLVKTELWRSTSTFLDNNALHMNADDYSSREMLLMAGRVAFVENPYHYRLHGESITKNISRKLYEPLLTDWMVVRLLEEHFSPRSPEARAAYGQVMLRTVGFMRNLALHGERLTGKEREASIRLVRESHGRIPFRKIPAADMSWGKKLLLLLPFRAAMAVVNNINKPVT